MKIDEIAKVIRPDAQNFLFKHRKVYDVYTTYLRTIDKYIDNVSIEYVALGYTANTLGDTVRAISSSIIIRNDSFELAVQQYRNWADRIDEIRNVLLEVCEIITFTIKIEPVTPGPSKHYKNGTD